MYFEPLRKGLENVDMIFISPWISDTSKSSDFFFKTFTARHDGGTASFRIEYCNLISSHVSHSMVSPHSQLSSCMSRPFLFFSLGKCTVEESRNSVSTLQTANVHDKRVARTSEPPTPPTFTTFEAQINNVSTSTRSIALN